MPPVEHVAVFELMPSALQQVLAAEIRPYVQQRQYVLELVAESKCTTRLIKAGSAPYPCTQRLVEEPAIDHQVELRVRRAHCACSQECVPACLYRFPGASDRGCLTVRPCEP